MVVSYALKKRFPTAWFCPHGTCTCTSNGYRGDCCETHTCCRSLINPAQFLWHVVVTAVVVAAALRAVLVPVVRPTG
eukprot:SAG22_NODE_3046_length_1988_cov_0.839598_2_plen_76_part_01